MRLQSILLAMCALILAACGGGAVTAQAPTEAPAVVAAGEYRLGAGDQLRITVFGEEELTGEYQVGPQGLISFPLVGEVEVGGRTLNEFARHLEDRLRVGFVREPRVSVEVLNYRPFFILGEVNDPGTYPYSANLTVMNAVATAGGFTYRANTNRVFIKHVGEPFEREYVLTSTTPVQPGDTVRIPERRF
jgi:polysaccharide export outer membrane protein